MNLPIQPPLSPMLAKLSGELPKGDGWLYEPKWDGFRAIVFRDGAELTVMSRDGKPLERYFPELLEPLAKHLPARCVVDGEVVVADDHGLDFDSLQLRIHPARSRVEMLSGQIPVSFVAFDLVAHGNSDLSSTPLLERRRKLEKALKKAVPIPPDASEEDAMRALYPGPKIALTPQTDDPDEAMRWFEEFENVGLDGIIAKPHDLGYVPGKRVMVKVKHRRTVDCVVGGYRLSKAGDGIGSLLLGVYDDDDVFHYVGHTSSFRAAQRRELLKELKPLEGGTSFVGGRAPGGPSRWTGARDISWIPLEPKLVCEVSFDYMQGSRFRHAATFVRWRTDKAPRECRMDQLPIRR